MSFASQPLAQLRLQQVFDSQFPIGAFAHSGGLETYAGHEGFDRHALRELLVTQIELGWGRLDLAAFVLAFRSPYDGAVLEKLAAEVGAWRMVRGQHQASLKLGRRLLVLLRRLYPAATEGFALEQPHQAVVAGALSARLGLPEEAAMLQFAQSSLTASLAAATRSMALSPEQAQEILTALQPRLVEAVERTLADPESGLFAATPALDVRARQQENLHTRLFQS